MNKCIVCGMLLDESSQLMICRNMPSSAQNIPSEDELDRDVSIDLPLCQCPGCGLVQFDCEPVDYYRDVIRSGGYSTTMRKLRENQYRHFIDFCHLEGKRIMEIGCGQGEFLRVLSEFPVEAYGIEHKQDLVDKAVGDGLNVWKDFAGSADHVINGAPYDAFLSFNFLEHQPDPNGMMQCIYHNLTDDGVGLITVPYLNYILENEGFYELLRDHIANYTFESLGFLLNKNGFEVLEEEIVNRDTISVIVRKRPKANIKGIQSNYERLTKQLNNYLDERTQKGKKVSVWGASHQGFTALSTTGVGDKIQYIIDSAPFKQGRFAPATHVPIVSPDYYYAYPVDCILIIAPGYTDEIAGIIREKYGKQVEISAIRTADIEIITEG